MGITIVFVGLAKPMNRLIFMRHPLTTIHAAHAAPLLRAVEHFSRMPLGNRTLLYSTSDTAWSDLANLAKIAAFDLFSNCAAGHNARAEQTSANRAFTAIGYPGDSSYESYN